MSSREITGKLPCYLFLFLKRIIWSATIATILREILPVWQKWLVVDPGQSAILIKFSKFSWKRKRCCVNWQHGMTPILLSELKIQANKKTKKWLLASTVYFTKKRLISSFVPKLCFRKGLNGVQTTLNWQMRIKIWRWYMLFVPLLSYKKKKTSLEYILLAE